MALVWLVGRHERRVEANAGRGHERCIKGNRSAASEDIEIAMRVVEAVWPRVCLGRAQAHLDWTKPCETKVDLIQVIEKFKSSM